MVKKTIKIIIEYDGTDYCGWQVQPRDRTVQEVIEEAAARVLRHPVKLIGAGRTDSGVHAMGQVAGFSTSSDMEPERMKYAINGVLPKDVTIVDAEIVPDNFNARFDAQSRQYRYTISLRRRSIGRSFSWHVPFKLDTGLLRESTRCLEGECNLRGFSKGQDDDDYSTIIFNNQWIMQDSVIIFEISAIRFFHHAVRSIVGSAVDVGRGKAPPDHLERILTTRVRKLAGPTAPARGLCLVSVDYGGQVHE